MNEFLKQVWWDVRLWAYRKLHKSLIVQWEENYHDLLVETSVNKISEQASSQSFKELDPEGTYCGYIPDDWLERINAKIDEKKEK